MKPKAIRQGDVVIILNQKIPKGAKKLDHKILAYGEVTGHKHQIKKGKAELYEKDGTLYLKVEDKAIVTHEQHPELEVPAGEHKIMIPQEFDYIEMIERQVID